VARVIERSKVAQYDDFTIVKYLEKNAMSGFKKTSNGIY
jgi:hypothetical protein